MARHLLLPGDEAALHQWLTEELHLVLVTGPILSGTPRRMTTDGFPWPLPDPPKPLDSSGPPRELLYWREGWSVNDLPAWGEGTALHRVAERLNKDAGATGDWLDLERTRVVRWQRCGWTSTGALQVGTVHGSARPAKVADPEVASLVRRIDRWLRAGAERVSLPESVRYRPAIFARPEAALWVAAGGEVWPWRG